MMTREKEYFIHLLAGFLNGEAPKPMAVDWTKIFELADKHSVQAIVSQQIKSLPAEAAPQGKLKSMFNQQIGFHDLRHSFATLSLNKEWISRQYPICSVIHTQGS